MFRLKEDLNEVNIWKPPQGYIFTPEFKANDIQILNETTVKSTSANTYKFAVMSPDIETGDFKEFKFHIKKK